MNNNFLTSALICVIILFALCVTIVMANWRFAARFKNTDTAIPEFSVDVSWEPYPRVINVENKFDCNASTLHKCDINDPTTLFGCRDLTVRCYHFDRDTKLRTESRDDGVAVPDLIIPKNKTPTEGYALAITDLAQACNPYHGDLTLVSVDANSDEYMMICWCKNPGYIGNVHLLGNCESLFVCDGKVVDINQPLEKIECSCKTNEHTVRYTNGLPTCKPLLVHEANTKYPSGWSHLVTYLHARQLPIGSFNPTVRDNLRVTALLDPCRSSLHDMSIAIPDGRYDSVLRTCGFSETGYPVESHMLTEPRAPHTADDVMARIGAVLSTGPYEYIRVTDQIAGKRKLAVLRATVYFDKEFNGKSLLLRLPDNTGIGRWSQVFMTTQPFFYGGKCEGQWPKYSCQIKDYFAFYSNGIPMSGRRGAPSSFLWGTENWEQSESLAQDSIKPALTGVSIQQDVLTGLRSAKLYGLLLTSERSGTLNGLLGFNADSDFSLHLNAITPPEK